ncbi:MAG TPA: hypothetical protein DIW44_09110 [Anaerolineaceae bacterium]|nr:hypothetical protein [Anaerolineaceae bacterium]
MMKKRIAITALLLTLLLSNASRTFVSADEIPIPYDYSKDVGENYIFVMLSTVPTSTYDMDSQFDESIRSKFNQSGLYHKDNSHLPIWSVDWYSYDFQIEISSDGKHLIEWGLLSYMYSDFDSIAFTLFENGKEIRKYAINEFVTFPFLIS